MDLVNRFRIEYATYTARRVTGPRAAIGPALHALRATMDRWESPPEWVRVLLRLAEAEESADLGDVDGALDMIGRLPDVGLHPVLERHRRVFHARLLLRGGRAQAARVVLAPLVESAGPWPAPLSQR